jgi:hypothetical protein
LAKRNACPPGRQIAAKPFVSIRFLVIRSSFLRSAGATFDDGGWPRNAGATFDDGG